MWPCRRTTQKTDGCGCPSQSHCRLAHHTCGQASTNPEVGDTAGRQRRCGIDCVIERSYVHHVLQREMLFVNEIEWKPGDSEIQRVRATKGACGSGPKRTSLQDIKDTRRSSSGTRGRLSTRHPLQPGWQPSQAHQANSQEDRPPSVICH